MARPATIRDEDLLEAARAVFLERGILATTADVAARAGVSEGTLFKRFGSKTGLFHRAVRTDELARDYARALLERGVELSGEAWVRALVRETLRFMRHLVPIVLVASSGGAEPGPDMRGTDPPPLRTRRPIVAEITRRMKAGELALRDARLVVEIVFGTCWHEVHMGLAMPDVERGRTDEEFVDGLSDLLWASLDPAIHARPTAAAPRKRR